MNLAAVWKLPVVVICENNLYGMSVPLSEASSVEDFSLRAARYGIPGHSIDRNNVLNVYESAAEAVARAGEEETRVYLQ